jgi:DNA-binding MarR family transcriptional regulator
MHRGRFVRFLSIAIPIGVPEDERVEASVERHPLCSTFLVRQAWLSMRAVVGEELTEHDLSVAQYAALWIVDKHPGVSVAELGRWMGSTRQSANELLTAMERAGLIDRPPHATDRRARQVRLTDAGRARFAAAEPTVRAVEQRLSAGFDPAELAVVQSWLNRMTAAAPDAVDS